MGDVLTVNDGIKTGDISDIQHYMDGNLLAIQEQPGAPGIQAVIDFENVISILALYVFGNYDGATNHCVDIEMWNYRTSAFDEFDSFSTRICPGAHTAWVFEDTDYINASNQAIMRLNHSIGGNNSHDLYIYYVALLY